VTAGAAAGVVSGGLLEKLLAAVRAEFRVDVFVLDPDDPVLGYKRCMVDSCDRPVQERDICSGHSGRWRKRGCPDLAAFVADAGPPLRGRTELRGCTVADCRYGAVGRGLCARHRDRWMHAGRPEVAAWAVAAPLVDGRGHNDCGLPFCALWTENDRSALCQSHTSRWRKAGCPDVDDFIGGCEQYGRPTIDFRGLPAQMRLELQYAVQCRHDERTMAAPPRLLRQTVRQASESGAHSLLDLSEAQWRERCARHHVTGDGMLRRRAGSLLLYGREAVEALRDGSGWEVEYHRDVWRIWMLPGVKTSASRPRTRSHVRFAGITQPWLRELVKRWVRWRLVSGLSVTTAVTDAQALTRFSAFLAVVVPNVEGLTGIDRALLERYLAWLKGLPGGTSTNEGRVGALHLFFQAIRQHGWDESLPTSAAFYTGDFPRRRQRVTRYLAEHVMTQVEQPANLDRWRHPEARLVTILLIRCGLRVSDACTLRFDCLLHDGQGAAYLRYYNNKMEREAAVPIDEELEAEIRAQQSRVLERWPAGNPNLFPRRTANVDGQRYFGPDSYRGMLRRWLAACDLRDEHGQPVHLTPHQWRHTFATRLINRDVPQEVIRVLLDHESTQMTAHYAKITDQTVRRRWEAATKVNIKGERVTLDPDGPLAQAQWAKTRYGMATQTLPNGYCGLPLQKSCPHANACLMRPAFSGQLFDG
jgi:integrase